MTVATAPQIRPQAIVPDRSLRPCPGRRASEDGPPVCPNPEAR
jgi:hypothetical protein